MRLGCVAPPLPLREVPFDVRGDVTQPLHALRQLGQVPPGPLCEPVRRGVRPELASGAGVGSGTGGGNNGAARKQKVHLVGVGLLQLQREAEGEGELVLFEERPAHRAEQQPQQVLVEQLQPLLHTMRWRALHDGAHEERGEPLEAELVADDEEERGGHGGHRLVLPPSLVNLTLRLLHHHLLLADLVGLDLTLIEHLHRLLVLQQIAAGGVQHLEDLVLDLLELAGLLVQPLRRDHERQERHLHAHLGQVVRPRQRRREEHAEVLVVRYRLVAQLDAQLAALFVGLPEQHGLQHGVELLAHVLHQQRAPELQRRLQVAAELPVRLPRGDQHAARAGGRVLDPPHRLALWVDDQRPPLRLRHHHRVLHREAVLRQPGEVPLLAHDVVPERRLERELVRAGELHLLEHRQPLVVQSVPVGGRQWWPSGSSRPRGRRSAAVRALASPRTGSPAAGGRPPGPSCGLAPPAGDSAWPPPPPAWPASPSERPCTRRTPPPLPSASAASAPRSSPPHGTCPSPASSSTARSTPATPAV
eukprot:1194250-Prorocentrum_minimum.AAC.7